MKKFLMVGVLAVGAALLSQQQASAWHKWNFSVGLNIATVIFNLVVGGVALYMMARTLSWRRLRTAQAEEAAS